jgi:hypothetical protein
VRTYLTGRFVRTKDYRRGNSKYFVDTEIQAYDFRRGKLVNLMIQVVTDRHPDERLGGLKEGDLVTMEAEIHADKSGRPYLLVLDKYLVLLSRGDAK